MKDRRKRNILIGSLCALLVFMGIGYAIISQMLTIRGVSTVAGDWNIYIDSITPNAVGTGVSVSESVGLDKISASFEANLYAPGDKVEYKVVVKNDGNIDAKLGAVNQHVTNDTEGIVKYSNTLENGYILRHGESYVFYVTTEIEEEKEELPVENTVRAVLELKLNFTQYTGGGSGDEPEAEKIQIVSGDLSTPGSEVQIGTEHFYVIGEDENNSDNVKLLAKYNLYVGSNVTLDTQISKTDCENAGNIFQGDYCFIYDYIDENDEKYNLQSASCVRPSSENYNLLTLGENYSLVVMATYNSSNKKDVLKSLTSEQRLSYIPLLENYGIRAFQYCSLAFDDDYNSNPYFQEPFETRKPYVYNENASISTFVNNYKDHLINKYNIDVSARLISYDEIVSLGCDLDYDTCLTDTVINNDRFWVFDTSYYSGNAFGEGEAIIVEDSGKFFNSPVVDDYPGYGVRPLVVVSKSIFN